jgi:uncharacterized membrane protein
VLSDYVILGRLRRSVYTIHPAVVHFPIALLLVNAGLTLFTLRRPDPFLERAAYGAMVIGWWGTLAAITTGIISAALEWPVSPEVLPWLNGHAVAGFALLIVYGRAILWRRRDPGVLHGPRASRYVILILLGAALVVLDAWLGGYIVYRLGVGVDPASR